MNPNPLNYATLEACQKLEKAEIVVETDFYHILPCQSHGMIPDGVIKTKEFAAKWNPRYIVPALSMAETWRLLLPFVFGHYEDMRDRVWTALLSDNPTDALIDLLIDLLIHIKELEKHENSLL